MKMLFFVGLMGFSIQSSDPAIYKVDKKTSFALFKVLKKNYPSPSYGKLSWVEGEFQLDSKGGIVACDLTVKTESISSGRLKQNDFVRGKELFDVENHPEIKLNCGKIDKTSETRYNGTVNLELKGIKTLVKGVIGRKIRDRRDEDWMTKKRQGIDLRFVVSRKKFGMNRGNIYKHGRKLELVISVEGIKD